MTRQGGGPTLLSSKEMTLSEVFSGLGRERFDEILGLILLGSLKTYKLFDNFKVRARLSKLNRDKLRKAASKLWERLLEGDDDLAREIAQAALISHIDFVVETLDYLKIPHDGNGFFDKEASLNGRLADGWREDALAKFRGERPEALVLLYINHLDWELGAPETVFVG